jgi:uncharacterized protein (TIGR00255 family)
MTGFGAASLRAGGAAFELEIRSVNHRHLDVRVRVPRLLSGLEADLRARIQERFARGKIDCAISSAEAGGPEPTLEIDREVARGYLEAARVLREEEGVGGTLEVASLLALPGVARLAEPVVEQEAVHPQVLRALDEAMDSLEGMRAAEGAAIQRDFESRLDHVAQLAGTLQERAGEVQTAVRARLERRMQKLQSETGLEDTARLQQELMLAADRLDVTEEIVRLRSHVDQFRATLAAGGSGKPVGRRLDFLLQELSREANTIGSKGADAPVAHLVVDLKTELERLREQVQNVE